MSGSSLSSRGPSTLIAVAVLALVVIGIYGNSLNVPFLFDDLSNIRDNRSLRMTDFGFEPLRRAAFSGPSSSRPVANISFALNHYFWADRVASYHAVNVAMHIVNGALVFILAHLTLSLAGRAACTSAAVRQPVPQWWVSLAAAMLFAAHPIATQSVTYTVQRMNILAVMFYLLSLLLWVAGRRCSVRWKRWAIWIAVMPCWLAALGSKQIAATLPLAVWLYEGFFFRDLDRRWLARSLIAAAAALATVVLIGLVYTGFDPWGRIADLYAQRDFTLAQRLMTQPRVIFIYIGLVLFPHATRLNLLHQIETSESAVEPIATLICIAALGVLLAITVRLATKHRLLSFCGIWFFIHMLIESSVWPLEMIFEHRMYLPMVGFALGAAYVLFHLVLPSRWPVAAAAAVLAVALLAAGASARNHAWQDPGRLWRDVLAKNPVSYRATMNLGLAHEEEGRLDKAIEHYHRSIKLNHEYARSWFNLGRALGQRNEIDKQIQCYRRAIELKATYAEAHNNLGMALHALRGAATTEAIEHFRTAIRHKPDLVEAYVNLGMAFHSLGRSDEAVRQYRRALQIDSSLAEAHNNLGIVAESHRRHAEAAGHYRDALRIDPDLADAHNNLANVLLAGGEFMEAIAHIQTAIELHPDMVAAWINLGRAAGMQGRLEEALEHMRRAVRVDAHSADAHSGLAASLLLMNRVQEAINSYRDAVGLEPDSAVLHFKMGIAVKQSGDMVAALSHFRTALRLRPDWPQPLVEVAWILATGSGGVQREPAEAVRLAERALRFVPDVDAHVLDVLDAMAAAYASAGRFEKAVEAAQKAIDLAVASGRHAVAANMRARQHRYNQGKALHESG